MAPSELARPRFGFQVLKPFTSPVLKSEFLPGMQGLVLHCQGDGAYVQVRDLFDADKNFIKDWISRDVIKIGSKPYGTWEIDICQIPRTSSKLTSNELDLLDNPNCKHLALAVSSFLQTLAKTAPSGLTSDNLNRLGGKSGTKVPWITTRVIEGIAKAGLLSVLNNPQFTIDHLVANSLDCDSSNALLQSGFYFRRYTSPDPSTPKVHCSLYVGQSSDLNARCQGWKRDDGAHEDVIASSTSIDMRAICLVAKVFYDDHKYIVEQLFTSLLQTYKDALLAKMSTASDGDAQDNFHLKNYCDMHAIATAAAKESGWTGAVLRKSFWEDSFDTCDGLNYQSPIAEAPKHEQSVWLRTDSYVPSDKPGQSIPVSNFRRALPKMMTVIGPSGKSASKEKSFDVFKIVSEDKKYRFRINRTLPKEGLKDGLEWPAENTYYDLIFEVRTDWKPHPLSWARLPLLGPFEDWDRANSWALRIDWKDTSGQNRFKYLHCEKPRTMMNSESNGSLLPYAHGIEIIHRFFKERIPIVQQHRWIQVPPMAIVKVMKHDHVNQSITIEAAKPSTTTAPISSRRKHPDVIKDEMEGRGIHGDFKLENVGLTLAEARSVTTVKFGNRRKCDTCMFISRNTGITIGCEVKQNKVCGNCLKLFGRPFCSWTPGIPAASQTGEVMLGNTFAELASRGDTVNAHRREALHGLQGWTGDAQVSADPAILEIETEADEMDDDEVDAAEDAADSFRGPWMGPSSLQRS